MIIDPTRCTQIPLRVISFRLLASFEGLPMEELAQGFWAIFVAVVLVRRQFRLRPDGKLVQVGLDVVDFVPR